MEPLLAQDGPHADVAPGPECQLVRPVRRHRDHDRRGENASGPSKKGALIGCGTDGGSLGLLANTSKPNYKSDYLGAGYTPNGILIKMVHSASS